MPAKKHAKKKEKPNLREATAEKMPAASDWRTSDEDEINRRLLRALDEKPRVTNLTPEHPVYSNFEVQSASGMYYEVEILSVEPRQCHCNCPDFRINGLGTCKHVEAVLLTLESRLKKRLFRRAIEQGSDRLDVLVNQDRQSLQLGGERPLLGILKRLFDPQRQLKPMISVDDALAQVAACRVDGLRISNEVELWHEHRRRASETQALRREYEQKVHSGEFPPNETKVPLYPYQREGMLHLAFRGRAMVADEMGLGKTIQAIAACALLHRLGKAKRAVIVAPASLKTEWEEQIKKFTDLTYQIVFGPKLQRLRAYDDHAPFFTLVNYEQIRPDGLEINTRLRPDIIVLDEAQRIKNWNTLTARAVKRLESRYAFVLTGTPIENRIDELYSIVDFLDPALLGPLFRFNRHYYQFDERGRPENYRNLEQLNERIKPVMLRRLKRDVETELPERTDRTHFVEMSPVQKESYRYHEEQVMKLVMAAKKRVLRKEEHDKLMRELAMMRMLCDTCYILDPNDRTCPKLPELENILDEYLAELDVKVLIFSEWVRMLDLVREMVAKHGYGYALHTGSVPQQKRREEIRAFKEDPNCRVFLCSESGGVGLNLQNASVVINCDLPWNPAKLEQRIARAWRKHQTRPVTVINLVSRNTIEHGMLGTLAAKRDLAQGVLDLEGDLDKITLKGGGQAFLEKLNQVLTKIEQTGKRDKPGSAHKPTPADPALAFAQACVESVGDQIVRCEEHFPHAEGASTILMVVVKSVTPEVEQAIKEQYKRLFRLKPGDKKENVTLEILDETTAATIARMQAMGLLQATTRAVRPLGTKEAAEAVTRARTPEEERRLTAYRQDAENKIKMAALLEGGGFVPEGRAALCDAILITARFLAVDARLPEPEDAETAFLPPMTRLWLGEHEVMKAFLNDSGSTAEVQGTLKRLLE